MMRSSVLISFVVLPGILVLALSSTTSAQEIPEIGRYRVHVNEEGVAKYDEDVIVDRKEETEKFHVPAHGDIPEADYLFDFKMNLTMIRIDAKKACFFLKTDPRVARPAEMIAAMDQMDKSPEVEAQKSSSSWTYSDAPVDRSTLSDAMAEMCADYRIIQLEPGAMHPASTEEVNETTRRFRRQFGVALCDPANVRLNCIHWQYQCRVKEFATSIPIMTKPCQIVPVPASGLPVFKCQEVHQRFQITCCDPYCP